MGIKPMLNKLSTQITFILYNLLSARNCPVAMWQCGVKIMLPCKKQEERAHADIRMNLRMLHTMDAENLNKKTVKMVTLVSFQQLL